MTRPTDDTDIAALLREIRDQQREALELQREHVALVQKNLVRAERINDRAEAIQARASTAGRIVLLVALPLLFLVLALMLWPYLGRLLA